MVLHGIMLHCRVLHGIACKWMVLHGTAHNQGDPSGERESGFEQEGDYSQFQGETQTTNPS